MYSSGSGHMNGSYYDPYAGSGNYGAGYTVPFCGGHGYNHYCLPGPVTPYQYLYPPPHPVPPPHHHHQHHPHYNHPQPGTSAPASFYAPSEASIPTQHQQQQPMWRPIVVPPGNCCCGCPNHISYYGSPWSNGPIANDAKVSNEPEPEDVKKLDGVKPVLWRDGSNSAQPQLFWIPRQYVGNLQQQGADMELQDGMSGGKLVPFDLDKLASLHDKGSNKPGAQKDFPFPIILMPSDSDDSRESTAKNRITEIEEKPSNTGPLKLLGNGDVKIMVPPEPVKTSDPQNDTISRGIQAQSEKVRVKDIPVKQAGESSEKKPSTNADVKSASGFVSPAKTSKLPPVCLRVDPLPRKKNGNGTPKPPSSLSHQKDTRQPTQPGNTNEDLNSKKKEVSVAKAPHCNTVKTKNVKVVEASSEDSPKGYPVSEKTENIKNGRENVNEGENMEKSAQPETLVGVEEGSAHDVKPRERISDETAAVRIQAAYRGYEERKWRSVQKLKQIAKVREQISSLKDRVGKLKNSVDMNKEEFERQRLAVGETIMSHLLTLDTIQGLHPSVRDLRKSVARELISLQEKLDLIHAQRIKEQGNEMNHGEGDDTDTNDVNEVPCRKTEEQNSSDMIRAGDQPENKQKESDTENMNQPDEGVDKNVSLTGDQQENKQKESDRENMNPPDESVDKSANLTENACADLHQHETSADDPLTEVTQDVIQPLGESPQEGKSPLILNTGNAADSKLMCSPDKVVDSGKEISAGITLEGQPVEVDDHYVAQAASEHETMANCNALPVDPHIVETSQTLVGGEESNQFSCGTTAEIGEVFSGGVDADGNIKASESGSQPTAGVNCKTIEHECNQVEEETKQQSVRYIATSWSEDILHKVEEIDKLQPSTGSSDDKPEELSDRINEITRQENRTTSEPAGIVNPNSSGLLNSNAASEVCANCKDSSDTISEGSVLTDSGCGAGRPEAAEIKSDNVNEKQDAPIEDVNCVAEDDRDSVETPRLSNVSSTCTENLALAEENDKLRETLQKLLESQKDQLAAISTLNGRLRHLEQRLKKKRNRRIKLHKSSNKSEEGDDQNSAICSM